MHEAKVLRIWRTEIEPGRAQDYEDFAHTRSLPMFRAQPGFTGVFFGGQDSHRTVITLWRDRESAKALSHSPSYNATVAAIEATGFLVGESSLELFDLSGVFEAC